MNRRSFLGLATATLAATLLGVEAGQDDPPPPPTPNDLPNPNLDPNP